MSIGEQIQRQDRRSGRRWDWILWWRIDAIDLAEEVRLYDSFSLTGCMRGFSVLFLILSMVVTTLMILVGGVRAGALVDVAVTGVLAVFIYLGHRWAMVGAMIGWTVEKAAYMVSGASVIIPDLLWWAIYMHAFYFAFRVEQERRKPAAALLAESLQ